MSIVVQLVPPFGPVYRTFFQRARMRSGGPRHDGSLFRTDWMGIKMVLTEHAVAFYLTVPPVAETLKSIVPV